MEHYFLLIIPYMINRFPVLLLHNATRGYCETDTRYRFLTQITRAYLGNISYPEVVNRVLLPIRSVEGHYWRTLRTIIMLEHDHNRSPVKYNNELRTKTYPLTRIKGFIDYTALPRYNIPLKVSDTISYGYFSELRLIHPSSLITLWWCTNTLYLTWYSLCYVVTAAVSDDNVIASISA